MAGLAAADRAAVAAELIPLYGKVVQTGSVVQAREARDGLFSLRSQVGAPSRRR